MNKSRVVIITLLIFVVAVAYSVFSVEGHANVRPVSARAHEISNPTRTPTPPYTPEAFIPVEMFALDENGFSRKILCSEEGNQLLYGCTAFCRDRDFTIDGRCGHQQELPYPYGKDSVPNLGVENDYLPDVLSQEMGPTYENVTLRAGAIAMRSFALQQREAVGIINNSVQPFQAFIPYKFNTLNAQYPNSTCGLPDPLINDNQKKICEAVAPRYYLSPDYNDYPARANHIGDILGDTETAYNAEGNIDKPYLIGVADPISFSCDAYNAGNRYGMSQSGANRWARGDQCSLAGNGSDPWSVTWTRPEQILFHYFTHVQLRDANNGKQILSPDWRWNPLQIDWGVASLNGQPPAMIAGSANSIKVQLHNTGIYLWTCLKGPSKPIPPPPSYRLRHRW